MNGKDFSIQEKNIEGSEHFNISKIGTEMLRDSDTFGEVLEDSGGRESCILY